MTHYGINPSFLQGRLPLMACALRRCRAFQVFVDGNPTPERSAVGPDGLPINDGRDHGLRLFDDMAGTMPSLPLELWKERYPDLKFRQNPGEACFVWSRSWNAVASSALQLRLPDSAGRWHVPSMKALQEFRPKIVRTLDLQRTNARPDWSKPRTSSTALLQGDVMAAELQRELAMYLRCSLWLPVPPRFELSVPEYEARLEQLLRAIHDPNLKHPPILEYGNELWNEDFPVNGWLRSLEVPAALPVQWTWAAAKEIAILKRVADRVFGAPGALGQRSYYLFVGGQLGQPSVLRAILQGLLNLGITPDMAGPALYAQPLRTQRAEWEQTKAVPTQEELRASCLSALELEIRPRLRAHVQLCEEFNVPYPSCYEVGQDMHAGPLPWRQAALEAQRTEWMGELYRAVRRELETAGIDVACWYSACTSQTPPGILNPFGLLEGVGLPLLPKALAARGD